MKHLLFTLGQISAWKMENALDVCELHMTAV